MSSTRGNSGVRELKASLYSSLSPAFSRFKRLGMKDKQHSCRASPGKHVPDVYKYIHTGDPQVLVYRWMCLLYADHVQSGRGDERASRVYRGDNAREEPEPSLRRIPRRDRWPCAYGPPHTHADVSRQRDNCRRSSSSLFLLGRTERPTGALAQRRKLLA